jgi:uncharacterized protein (DUF305 family)
MAERAEFPWPWGWWRTVVLIVLLCALTGVVVWAFTRPTEDTFNSVDVGFLTDMTTHHNGAIGLSFAYLDHANDPLVTQFAHEIILGQAQEIAVMNSLLSDSRNGQKPSTGVAMEWMGHPVPVAQMPGMPTSTQLDELRAATGSAADEQFTRLMILHHAAAVAMGTYAAQNGENTKVKNLASAIVRAQRAEIAEMNTRRKTLGFAPVDPTQLEQLSAHAS